MEKLSPDILMEAFSLQLNEVSQTGSREELEAVMKYAQRAMMRMLAPQLLEKEAAVSEAIEGREMKKMLLKMKEPKGLINMFNAPVGQAMGSVGMVETKN